MPGNWKAVVHDKTVTWLANWVENVNGNYKYVFLAAGSSLKGQSDMSKFEKARELKVRTMSAVVIQPLIRYLRHMSIKSGLTTQLILRIRSWQIDNGPPLCISSIDLLFVLEMRREKMKRILLVVVHFGASTLRWKLRPSSSSTFSVKTRFDTTIAYP